MLLLADLRLVKLRLLLAKALQVSVGALNYMQYKDSDGDWYTVVNDNDIQDGLTCFHGAELHLTVLRRGMADAVRTSVVDKGAQPQQPSPAEPALAIRDAATNAGPSALHDTSDTTDRLNELRTAVESGCIEQWARQGTRLKKAIKLAKRAIDAGLLCVGRAKRSFLR